MGMFYNCEEILTDRKVAVNLRLSACAWVIRQF